MCVLIKVLPLCLHKDSECTIVKVVCVPLRVHTLNTHIGGFLESSIDQLQVLHKRISTEAMEQPSARREVCGGREGEGQHIVFSTLYSYHSVHATSQQDSPHIAELISVVHLIRNLLYKSFHSKVCYAFTSQGYGFTDFCLFVFRLLHCLAICPQLFRRYGHGVVPVADY